MGGRAHRRRWPRRLAVGAAAVVVVAGAMAVYAWDRGWLTRTYLAASRPCGDLEPSHRVNPPTDGPLATLSPVTAEVFEPTALAFHPSLDLGYLAERAGGLRAVRAGAVDAEPVLDLSDDLSTRGEQGLLGLTVDPAGTHLYAYLTDAAGAMRLDAFPLDEAGHPQLEGRRAIVGAPLPDTDHNGGGLAFGPDGLLYVGVGDGGLVGDRHHNAQSTATLLGKVLRLAPEPGSEPPYRVPDDNPFVGVHGARPEIWVLGVRNPWRLAFAADGRMWLPDLGHSCLEEVNLLPAGSRAAGANLGWNRYEGTRSFLGGELPGKVDPLFEYPHEDGRCAVIGGVVMADQSLPDLAGSFLVGDFCHGGLLAVSDPADGPSTVRDLGVRHPLVTALAADRAGRVWVLTRFDGLFRLEPGAAPASPPAQPGQPSGSPPAEPGQPSG